MKRRTFLGNMVLCSSLPGLSSLQAFSQSIPQSQAANKAGTRGVILNTRDLSTLDWPKLAHDAGLNTLGTHIFPGEVVAFLQNDAGRRFLDGCEKYNIQVEHELHAIRELLPRTLFEKNPNFFRMNEKGERTPDWNCCPHSEGALNVIAENAVKIAKVCRSTTRRYFYWLDDGAPVCQCPKCRELSSSDQAVLIENAIVARLRSETDPNATLAHLAYHKSIVPPKNIKPAPALFLEFAPIHRVWNKPLTDFQAGQKGQLNHGQILKVLDDNLTVFPAATAQVLEYWLDVSLFSSWKKPAKKLPWNAEVCQNDVQCYAIRGIRNFTSFAVYIDDVYQKTYKDLGFLKEYGDILKKTVM